MGVASVFLYVPNLIGYCRVVSTLTALALAGSRPERFLFFYFVAFAADALDGWVARKLNQVSTFGAVLDMVTDRCGTVGLLAVLCKLAPERAFTWICLMWLDVASHWFQVQAAALHKEASHKNAKSGNFLLQLYYKNRLFMGFCCVSAEFVLLCVFALCNTEPLRTFSNAPTWTIPWLNAINGKSNSDPPDVVVISLLVFCIPGFLLKQLANVSQLISSSQRIAELNLKVE